jgi:rare lipoprotein A
LHPAGLLPPGQNSDPHSSVETGQTVKVKVNDRGPFAQGRVIDLSVSAAEEIGLTQDGEAKVRIEEFASDQP